MRTIILAALIGTALTGCNEPLPTVEGKDREQVRQMAARAMCSEDAVTKSSAISGLARSQDELEAHVGDAVDDELASIERTGCTPSAKAPDKAAQFADKFVKEQIAKEGGEAQAVITKKAATAATSDTTE